MIYTIYKSVDNFENGVSFTNTEPFVVKLRHEFK